MRLEPKLIALFSVLTVAVLYYATEDIALELSPQGCRMSYMYPSYVLQDGFDLVWTPLARRYSLWLYREVDGYGRGWEGTNVSQGLGTPVLFIPGNAGSSRQVRSIASSATRQYFDAPFSVAPEFRGTAVKPLDFFAVEFNEDLSAFHGPTLEAQTAYTARAVAYILSFYPPGTQITVMGHSMGGVVAAALLPSAHIAAVITMSTPHTLPPARFDARIDAVYGRNQRVLRGDAGTPIVSLCGGAADMMIPSEACILPPVAAPRDVFRRTVFTSALEGAWTGVGHREMVWCHQVRWRVARAALELGAMGSPQALDRWLRDGHGPAPLLHAAGSQVDDGDVVPDGLQLQNPRGNRTYRLPVPASEARFVMLVSGGSVGPVGPHKVGTLAVSTSSCQDENARCSVLEPTTLKLIPNPLPERPFPVPQEGADESEGAVLFEAVVPKGSRWISVSVTGGQGSGWIAAGLTTEQKIENGAGTLRLMFGHVSATLPTSPNLKTTLSFPNLLSNALIVHRVTLEGADSCPERPLFEPLIAHTSHPSETHYFPLSGSRILLHTHASAPHVVSPLTGIEFTIYSSACRPTLNISVDWTATLGRVATRYFTAVPAWAVGVVSILLLNAWRSATEVPDVPSNIDDFVGKPLRRMLLASVLLSAVPLPVEFYLGNAGHLLFSGIAPVLLLVATGFVVVSWWILRVLMWPLGKLGGSRFKRRREDSSVHRSTLISMALVLLLIFLVVPWQVAFLGCWAIHLYNCAGSQVHLKHLASIPDTVAIPLLRQQDGHEASDVARRPSATPPYITANHNHSMHLLLLMTWLLPLAAPVLVVWARTLATAGLTTPFDGDHFVLSVAPFLLLVDFLTWVGGPVFEEQRFERRLSVRWIFVALGAAAFLMGSRKAYFVFDVAKVAIGLVVVVRIGPRYWGRSGWNPL
ncbi:unnamed protein product [Mycena citricolor]|uniref:GPI inositol-deacylase n=1 Tax=Mycena citricolor TaxID=2018698 RepID=A0AAD2GRE1_9AGAR|nr:unnamed protein product [Mycena citricolor]